MSGQWRTKLRDFYVKTLGRAVVQSIDGFFTRFSKVENKPFFDSAEFVWIEKTEQDWPAIRAELDALLRYRELLPSIQDISQEQYALSQDSGWKSIFFYAYGLKSGGNCARCPATAAALKSIPGMQTALFSILEPGKRLPAHRGTFKGVLRYHLGLLVPDPPEKCGLRVVDQIRHWGEGQSLVFDDALDHEAWNDTNEVRAVLIVDFVRPMWFPASAINRGLIWLIARSPYVRDAVKKQRAWEQEFAKTFGAPDAQ